MGPSKVESLDPRWRNIHLRSIYREAEEFDVGRLLRKCITLSSLHSLLLSQEPFVPSWLAVDGDTKDPEFWVETLADVSARSNEYIGAGAASFHDSLGLQSQALCTSHALAHLRKNLNPDSCSKGNPTPNSNGKRPRSDIIESAAGSPRSAITSPNAPDKPNLTLNNWLKICDGERKGWKDIHAQWNHMIARSKSAKIKSWDNLEKNWEPQGLTLSLGYYVDITKRLTSKCSSLISELSKGQTESNNSPPASYIRIVRGLDNLWPASKNTEFERCIQEVVDGDFRPQATEELLGYMLELARIIKGATITVHRKSQQAELKKAEALSRRQARQLKEEQKEKEMKKREELCRQAQEDFGRDILALDDERASIDMISANLRETQAICEERERTLAAKEALFAARGGVLTAKEASFAEREGELAAKETSCTARDEALTAKETSCAEREGALMANKTSYTDKEERIAKMELELRTKLEAYEVNQKALLEGQRRVNKGDASLARSKAAMAKRDTANTGREKSLKEKERCAENQEKNRCTSGVAEFNAREKNLKERERSVENQEKNIVARRALIHQKENAAADREKLCITKEVELNAMEINLKERERSVENNKKDIVAHWTLVKKRGNAATDRERLCVTKEAEFNAREEALCKGQAIVASERQELDTQESALRQKQSAYQGAKGVLIGREEELSKERAEVVAERQVVEAQKLVFKQDLALHREGKKTLKANSEELEKERAVILRDQKDMEVARDAFDLKKSALRAEQASVSCKKKEVTTAMRTLEDEKLALKNWQTALSCDKQKTAAAKQALEDEKSALTAKQALFEEEKTAWREKVGKNVQQMRQMQENMQQMQEMQKDLSSW
ncbi:hypothetical protein ACLOAV_005282 [Pseudogymnoascus australis]